MITLWQCQLDFRCFVFTGVLLFVTICGCNSPVTQMKEAEPNVNSIDALGDEFLMAPPTFVQEHEKRMMAKFLWDRCLPPNKPIILVQDKDDLKDG